MNLTKGKFNGPFSMKIIYLTILYLIIVFLLVYFNKKNLYDIELEKTRKIAYQIYSFVHSIPYDSNVSYDSNQSILDNVDKSEEVKENVNQYSEYYRNKFNYLLTILQNLREFYSIDFKTQIIKLDQLYQINNYLANIINNNKEYLEILEDNEPISMKVMLPLIYKKNCSICHTDFMYKENNLIGVLSVTYSPTLLKERVKLSSFVIITLFTLLWLIFCLILYFYEHKLKNSLKLLIEKKDELNQIRDLLDNFINIYPDPIIYRDNQGRWIKANSSTLNLLDLKNTDYYLKTTQELMQDKAPEIKELFNKCIETDKLVIMNKKIYRNIETIIKSGQREIYLEVIKIPIFDNNNNVKGIFIISKDITSMKQAEDELMKNQEFLKVLLDSIPIAVFYKDRYFRYLGFNRYFKELFEIDEKDYIGKTVFDVWDHNLASVYHQMDLDLMNNPDKIQVYEYIIKKRDGNVREGIFYKSVFKDENGNINGIIGAFSDITELKQQQRELKKFKTIINQLSESVIIANSHKIIEYVNDTFKTSKRYQEENIIGKSLIDFFNNENYNIDLDLIWSDLNNGIKWIGEFVTKKEGKILIEEEISIIPIIEQNTLTNIVLLIRDITDKKLAQKNILQAQKLESIGKLASGIAHEFNNMLSIIQGNIELLQLKLRHVESIKNHVDNIQKIIDRGSNLIRQLLTFTVSTQSEFVDVNLNQIILDLKHILKEIAAPNIKLDLNLQENLPIIKGNPSNINQIIMNICLNAIDAMPNGGTLSIKTQKVFIDNSSKEYHILGIYGEFIQLSIQDTGIGMTQDVISRIFDPFFTTKDFGKGTGLGLYIVYWLTQNHNAKIDVISTPNQGTIFNIYFPIEKESLNYTHTSTLKILSKATRKSETILLVEDDEKLRDVILELLKLDNYEVLVASNFKEAMDIFSSEKEHIKLILSDFMFPDGNAIDLFSQCRNIKKSLKFILMTGYLDIREEFPEIESFNIKLLLKPFKIIDLKKMILDSLNNS